MLEVAGISATPRPGYTNVGFAKTGVPIFSSIKLAKSKDTTAGELFLHTLAALITPFNAMTGHQINGLKRGINATSSMSLAKTLDETAVEKTADRFLTSVLRAVGSNVSDSLGKLCAKKLYIVWSLLSPAQKSLGLAGLTIQTHKCENGKTLCDQIVIADKGAPILTVKEALLMFKGGKNVYSLVLNWDQISDLHKVMHGEPNASSMMDFAQTHGLLGTGMKGHATIGPNPNPSPDSPSKPVPQYGVGAVAVAPGQSPPRGYARTATLPQATIHVPPQHVSSSINSLVGSLAGSAAGNGGLSPGTLKIYKGWKKSDQKTMNKGAGGGTQLIAGIQNFKKSNPFLYGAAVAIGTHKGNTATYTIPMEYAASLVGVALARLISGRMDKDADGLLLTRNALQGVGTEFNQQNFSKFQSTVHALYSREGISSKADAFQISNQEYSEGRVNETDLVAMQETFSFVYSPTGFSDFKNLLIGKDRGLEVAREASPMHNAMLTFQDKADMMAFQQMTKDEARQRNAAKYQSGATQQQPAAPEEAPQTDQAAGPEDASEVPSAPGGP